MLAHARVCEENKLEELEKKRLLRMPIETISRLKVQV